MIKKLVIAIIVLISLVNFAAAVSSPIQDPHWFYGTAQLTGTAISAGSTITATIGGSERGSITITTAGQYGASGSGTKLAVTGCGTDESCYSSTQTITFTATIQDYTGVTCGTATFTAGKLEEKNLECTGTFVGTTGGTPGVGGATGGGGSAAGGGGGGGAAPAAPTETLTEVTSSSVISNIQQSLPAGWDNIKVEQVGSTTSKTTTAAVATIDNALSFATDPDAISALQTLKNAIASGELDGISVTSTLSVYKITNKNTGEVEYRSQIKLIFTAPYDMEEVKIIETIPKEMASTIEDMVFIGEKPTTILQADPIVEWVFDSIPKGQTKDLSYIIKKKITEIKSITTAAGKKVEAVAPPPPLEEKKPRIVTAQVIIGITIMVLIVLIGLGIYYMVARKKKEW